MKKEKVLDWLAETALTALEQKSKVAPSWITGKRHGRTGLSRINVRQWIVFDLDDGNLLIVADHLGISLQDLAAVRRVLSKI